MQRLPYVVVTNPHLTHVYELYYKAFETFRKQKEIKTIDDNEKYCRVVSDMLKEHLIVIPNLALGVLECQHLVAPELMDTFMNGMLRAHLALTETFNSPWHFEQPTHESEFVGEVLLRCKAKEVIEDCGKAAQDLCRHIEGNKCPIPQINIRGHTEATFPYILSQLEYIIGELLRNSVQALMAKYEASKTEPPPIDVLICEAPQHVIIRISDQGGGIPRDIVPYLWSFTKGPRRGTRMTNWQKVPSMAATNEELMVNLKGTQNKRDDSLSTLSSRPPDLRLGMGLPMSRVYAEYWAGALELHSLEGHGVDAFLTISKLGNQNEQLSTRESIDSV
ncbi:putative pyruvate dehydrogenase kinase [Phaeomoniella chlamydospora]|uniref:Protein-serine/threonine kinase n=1 Tax=Phaeomoniella chlamydospora TaxID=158046 RepID=A0A0G2E7U2_PHACM|nr:putative pyruvate dehydrogenase kinase [Phaeomoniella chlamydospora]